MSIPGHISRVSHFDNSRYQNKHTHRADSTNRKTQMQRHHLQAEHAARLAHPRLHQLPNQIGVITHVSKTPSYDQYLNSLQSDTVRLNFKVLQVVYKSLSAPVHADTRPLTKVKVVVVTLGNETADEMARIFATLNKESLTRPRYKFEELIDHPEMIELKSYKEYEFDEPLTFQPGQVELMLADLQKFLVNKRNDGVELDLLNAIENALS